MPEIGMSGSMSGVGKRSLLATAPNLGSTNEADDITDLLLFQIVIEGGHGKTGIGPKEDQGSRIGLLQLLDQSFEHCHRPLGGVGVSGAQHRGQGKTVATVEDEERVIHMLFVITMKKS
jgi:hypothetical protein